MAAGREKLLFAGILVALLGAVPIAYFVVLGRGSGAPAEPGPPSPPEPVPAETAVLEALKVTRVAGPARIRRAGKADGGAEARIGDEVEKDDVVETGEGGSMQLAAGERFRVDLEENAQVGVREITAELTRVRLHSGLLTAKVKDDPARSFEVESGDGKVARTRGADFSVSAGGTGLVAVGVSRGEASFESAGKVVVIKTGHQSLAKMGEGPSAPAPIPKSLLLKVAWPKQGVLNRRKIVVSGSTDPGAHLAIGGHPVTVGPDGRFRQEVFLREGEQFLDATARDVGGHTHTDKSPKLDVDTKAAGFDIKTRDLWGKRRK